jgi:ABC-type spermidine/putrescine transport system permease subunit I
MVVKSYKAKSFASLSGTTVGMIYKRIRNERLNKCFIQSIIYAGFTTVTVIDLMITSAMCYYLKKSQSSFVG